MRTDRLLKKSGLPQDEAEYLLAHVLHTDTAHLLAHPEHLVSFISTLRFLRLCSLRRQHKPLAYLTQEQFFYGQKFMVNPRVLIPRHTTEILVDSAVQIIEQNEHINTVIDIGTGSGAIVIATALAVNQNRKNTIRWHASDVSSSSLRVAQKNAAKLNAPAITWHKGSLIEPVAHLLQNNASKTLLLANLPYLSYEDYAKTEMQISFEPEHALLSGIDGLNHYRRLVQELALLPLGGLHAIFETDPCNIEMLARYMSEQLPGATLEMTQDELSLPRFIFAHWFA
ncbi:MAG: HemK/PrmC family methyltransferase [Patescibacteria group bacterium]|jgi:release factor glutamine methyltransferase